MKKLTRSDAEITLSKPLLGAIECNCGCGQKEINVNLILLMNDIGHDLSLHHVGNAVRHHDEKCHRSKPD